MGNCIETDEDQVKRLIKEAQLRKFYREKQKRVTLNAKLKNQTFYGKKIIVAYGKNLPPIIPPQRYHTSSHNERKNAVQTERKITINKEQKEMKQTQSFSAPSEEQQCILKESIILKNVDGK